MDNRFLWLGLTAFIICLALGPVVIPLLHKFKFGQSIRGCGPEEHKKKAGTPTMGGLMFLFAILVALGIWCEFTPALLVAVFLTFGHAVIGLLDDGIKIVKHRNLGLTAKEKLFLQMLLAAGFIWFAEVNNFSTVLWIPGLNWYWDWGMVYYVLVFLLLVGTTNAVNLTDGLDGLVSSVSLPVFFTFGVFALAQNQMDMAYFATAVLGGVAGFLYFNLHPAKVFMGDTGSLALGGAVAALAMLLKCEVLLIILGGVYVAETMSVILQVGYFKLTHGKRIFRMAPLHHHFELGGWGEVKTVVIFSLASYVLCVAGFLLWLMK